MIKFKSKGKNDKTHYTLKDITRLRLIGEWHNEATQAIKLINHISSHGKVYPRLVKMLRMKETLNDIKNKLFNLRKNGITMLVRSVCALLTEQMAEPSKIQFLYSAGSVQVVLNPRKRTMLSFDRTLRVYRKKLELLKNRLSLVDSIVLKFK